MSTERFRFIDSVLDTTYEAAQHPDTIAYLGQSIVDHVLSTLESTVVANVRHGVITIPHTAEQDAIPVVAMLPNESFRRGEAFGKLTVTQQLVYQRVFAEWDPLAMTPEAAIAMITGIPQPDFTVPAPGEYTGALTSTSDVITRTDALTGMFGLRNRPVHTAVKFMFRPLVVVKMNFVEPDVMCHEMVHADQKLTDPIRLFSSQYDLNMDSLGDETFAYHIGAGVRLGMESRKPWRSQQDPFMQMAAERVRLNHNTGMRDPFAPSELLLTAFTENSMSHILHSVLDYETITQNLDST
ncbi:MAG: hypothetical protein ACHQT5_00785 [Candidatus Saccharimonadales bacterium]|jgi:hypothetical protein